MMFIRVVLEDFLSPNDLILKAPSSKAEDTCSRATKRPKPHTKRILGLRGQIFTKDLYVFKIRVVEQAQQL